MNAVELENITHRYGKVTALDGLCLTVRQGEMFGFLGRNGAGKTTTLKLLMGLLRADRGDIAVLGQRVTRMPVSLKQRIGYVCQEPNFYPWMTADQLGSFVGGFYPTWDAPEFQRLLRLLDVPRDRRASEMSGGTRTKLGLALALAPRPQLLLLDEPTAGLDPESADSFCTLLRSLHQAMELTVVMVTHDLDTLFELSTRIAVLADQRVIIVDTPQQVVAFKHPFIEAFFRGGRGQRAIGVLHESPATDRTLEKKEH